MKNYKKVLGIAALLVFAVLLAGCGGANQQVQAIDPLSENAGGMANWPIIGWLASLFGYLMRGIYIVLSKINIYSATVCIVIFTVVTRMLLLPLTIKQQKFTKVQSLMSPEIQALQKKYEGRRDQASMAKMQAEQQAIYDKYGSSMSSGCLPSLIQLPLLFALYPVIQYFGHYVPEIRSIDPSIQAKFFMLFNNIDLQAMPKDTFSFSTMFTNFTWLIPILAGLLQFLSTKLMGTPQPETNDKNSPASSMKMMTYMMPLLTVFIGFSLPSFLGIYWVVQSLVMVVQQFIINKKMDKIPVEEIIKQNIEKRNKKRAKKGLPPISEKATTNTKNVDVKATKTQEELEKRDEQIKQSTQYYQSRNAAPGSLAAKANMVKEYNEKHK